MEVARLTITPNDPLAKILLPVPTTLCSASLEVLVSKGELLLKGDSNDLFEPEANISAQPLQVLCASESIAKKGVTVLAGVIDPGYKREIELLLHNGGNKECVWRTRESLGCLLVSPCLVITVTRKLQPKQAGMVQALQQ